MLLPARAEDAPQIWAVNGVSLSFSRARIAAQDRGDLVVAYSGELPVSLRGSVFSSRSHSFRLGLTGAELRSSLGAPTSEAGALWSYVDPDRRAELRVGFWHGRVSSYTVLRRP